MSNPIQNSGPIPQSILDTLSEAVMQIPDGIFAKSSNPYLIGLKHFGALQKNKLTLITNEARIDPLQMVDHSVCLEQNSSDFMILMDHIKRNLLDPRGDWIDNAHISVFIAGHKNNKKFSKEWWGLQRDRLTPKYLVGYMRDLTDICEAHNLTALVLVNNCQFESDGIKLNLSFSQENTDKDAIMTRKNCSELAVVKRTRSFDSIVCKAGNREFGITIGTKWCKTYSLMESQFNV